jgi:hypothetical protein
MAAQSMNDVRMDAANLYREENYTDLRAGSVRKLVPVTSAGADDPSREAIFTAATQVMTPGGVLPLSGEIEGAKSLEEAIAGFPAAIQKAVVALREEMEAMQRERASQIVVPGRDGAPPSDLLIR